jgi:hypothetical protein
MAVSINYLFYLMLGIRRDVYDVPLDAESSVLKPLLEYSLPALSYPASPTLLLANSPTVTEAGLPDRVQTRPTTPRQVGISTISR